MYKCLYFSIEWSSFIDTVSARIQYIQTYFNPFKVLLRRRETSWALRQLTGARRWGARTGSPRPGAAAARSQSQQFTFNLALIQKVNRADPARWMTVLQHDFRSRERQVWSQAESRTRCWGSEELHREAARLERVDGARGAEDRTAETAGRKSFAVAATTKVSLPLDEEQQSKTGMNFWDCEERERRDSGDLYTPF